MPINKSRFSNKSTETLDQRNLHLDIQTNKCSETQEERKKKLKTTRAVDQKVIETTLYIEQKKVTGNNPV